MFTRDNSTSRKTNSLMRIFSKQVLNNSQDNKWITQELKNDSKPEDGFFNPLNVPKDWGLKFVANPIPGELIQHVRTLKSPFKLPECTNQKPKHNFVYIKTHKAASDTLAALFRRFAYQRNLSQVLPVGGHVNLGWPYDFRREYHRVSKFGVYNTLVDHSKFTEPYLRELMPKDTVYITSWRETFSHLKSAMAYFYIRQWTGIKEDPPDGMDIFLKDLKGYDDLYKKLPPNNPFRPAHSCIPGEISMARNSMAADLGFPVGFPKDEYPDYSDSYTAIKEWLEHSNQVFSVVLLSDYFHHSLIMLKRMMCWSTKDILYERMNSWNTKYRPEYRQELVDNFRRWGAADYLAFELFNQTLWDRIAEWGHADFMAELTHFEETLGTVTSYCKLARDEKMRDKTNDKLEVKNSKWNDNFYVTREECVLMKDHMRKTIKKQYDDIPVIVETHPASKVPFC